MSNHVCYNCDGVIESVNLVHNCIRGITDNINRLHCNMNLLNISKLNHLDGLKYALDVVEEVERTYISMGISYDHRNPFHAITDRIRILLGLPYIERKP